MSPLFLTLMLALANSLASICICPNMSKQLNTFKKYCFGKYFPQLQWSYILISQWKSIDLYSGGRAPCCAIAAPPAVAHEQDSRCVPVIATYPPDYCQRMSLQWVCFCVRMIGPAPTAGSPLRALPKYAKCFKVNLRLNRNTAATSAVLHLWA